MKRRLPALQGHSCAGCRFLLQISQALRNPPLHTACSRLAHPWVSQTTSSPFPALPTPFLLQAQHCWKRD